MGRQDHKRKMHAIKWKKIRKPISEVGLRIRYTKNKKLPLLAKTC